MTRLLIELPDRLDARARARAAEAGYADVEEYVRALIAADSEEAFVANLEAPAHLVFHTQAELEVKLLAGLASGPTAEITPTEWSEKRRRLQERHSPHQSS